MKRTDPNDPVFYVYQLRAINEDNPFYIGKGCKRRAYRHLQSGQLKVDSHKVRKIKKLISKGIEILVEFLETNLTEPEAFKSEIHHIAKFGLENLTNGHHGGEGGSAGIKQSEEHILKRTGQNIGKSYGKGVKKSSTEKYKKPKTKEHAENIRKARLGVPRPRRMCCICNRDFPDFLLRKHKIKCLREFIGPIKPL